MQQVQNRLSVGDLVARPAQQQAAAVAAAQGRESEKAGFSALVTQMLQKKPASRQGALEDLMAQLDDEEREFADQPSRERFDSYRKTVKELCGMLLNRSYRLHGWEDKRQRRYEIVKTIDQRLAQLYTGLLRRNQDVVIALHLMGQIRGLIFDLKA